MQAPITASTRRFLKIKTLKYLLTHDQEKLFRRYVLKKPLKYLFGYLKSLFKKRRTTQEGDLLFFNLKDQTAFREALGRPLTRLILGFSFCQKPLQCPDLRFTPHCRADPHHPVCSQCFICPIKRSYPHTLIIPTIFDIGKKIFTALETTDSRDLLFLITACPLSLEMFADFSHMAGIRGIGVRLEGRICNTFKAFKLAEGGIKPGLTTLSPHTRRLLTTLLSLDP